MQQQAVQQLNMDKLWDVLGKDAPCCAKELAQAAAQAQAMKGRVPYRVTPIQFAQMTATRFLYQRGVLVLQPDNRLALTEHVQQVLGLM